MTNIDPELIKQSAIKLARDRFLPFCVYMQRDFKLGKHIKLIAEKLEAVERGDCKRLIITLPPRHGKSFLCSTYFPAWYLGKNPRKQIIAASYGDELARKFGRDVRNTIADSRYSEIFETRLAEDSQSIGKFNTNENGVYLATGVGGAATGYGADCVTGDTKIITPTGEYEIKQLVDNKYCGEVLSYNHNLGEYEWKNVVIGVDRGIKDCYEVETNSGFKIKATGNHKIYTAKQGYKNIDDLQIGESTIVMPRFGDTCDSIRSITKIGRYNVYDLQIADNHNFFANNILVHNCLFIDDPIRGRQDADSEVIREKIMDWYTSVARTRLMPNGAVVIIGTRWHKEDLIGQLLKTNSEKWEVLQFPALNDKDEALWPEMWTAEQMKETRSAIGQRDWLCLYQGIPSDPENQVFHPEYFRYYEQPDDGQFVVAAVDAAFTKNNSSDYSAISVLGIKNDKFQVLDYIKEKLDPSELINAIIRINDKWKPQLLGIEAVAAQRVIGFYLKEKRPDIVYQEIKTTTDKLNKIKRLEPYIREGRLTWKRHMTEIEKELLEFPQGSHDDLIDSLSMALELPIVKKLTSSSEYNGAINKYLGKQNDGTSLQMWNTIQKSIL